MYACRRCARHYSLAEQDSVLVEESPIEDSGERTVKIKARRPAKRPAERLTEMYPPSAQKPIPRDVQVTLEFTDGPERGRSVRLARTRCVVGRELGEVLVHDPLVSRRHAVVEIYDADTIILTDLTSTNGTYHNGRLIDHCKLFDGDEVRLGSSILSVLIETAG